MDRASFKKAQAVLLELANGKRLEVLDSTLEQVENMASLSKVPITQKQKYLYAVLREMTGNTEKGPTSPETPGTKPPWAINDRPLLAEVFRLTSDMMNFNSFMRANPIAFKTRVVEPQT